MAPIDLVLRTAATLLLLLLAALLLRVRRRDHTPVLGALCCAAVAAFVLTSTRGAGAWLGVWLYPFTALCVAKAALFWLFAKGLFADGFRVRPPHLAALALAAGYGSWQQLVFAERERAGAASPWETAAGFGFEALTLGFVLLALAEAWRGLAVDLVERRRRMRVLFVAVTGGYLAAAVGVQGYNLALGTDTPAPLVSANLALIFVGALVASWTLVRLRTASWLEPEPQPAPRPLPAAEARLLAVLRQALETDRVYREEGLTIGALARRLGTQEHVLRRVINRGLGFRNFSDFLHAWRLREACERLRRPDQARLPVLSIALDVGYGSIGPFNRAFKARMGMTPSAFRRGARSGSGPGDPEPSCTTGVHLPHGGGPRSTLPG